MADLKNDDMFHVRRKENPVLTEYEMANLQPVQPAFGRNGASFRHCRQCFHPLAQSAYEASRRSWIVKRNEVKNAIEIGFRRRSDDELARHFA